MTRILPILPLRDIVVFPHRIVPLFVGREKSVAALEAAMASDKSLFLVAQLDPSEDDPERDQLYDLGVIATAMQLLKLPDGTVRVLVEGVRRARLVELVDSDGHLAAVVEDVDEEEAAQPEAQALMQQAKQEVIAGGAIGNAVSLTSPVSMSAQGADAAAAQTARAPVLAAQNMVDQLPPLQGANLLAQIDQYKAANPQAAVYDGTSPGAKANLLLADWEAQNAQLREQTSAAWLTFYNGLNDQQKTMVSTALKQQFAKMEQRHEKMKERWEQHRAAKAASAPAQ